MPLANVQRALALLYTDATQRERLRCDPALFAASFALDSADLAQVMSMGDVRLRAYSDSLDRKRANAAIRHFPLCARAIGPRFRAEFLRFARRVPLDEGERRYASDALAFATTMTSSNGTTFDAAERALLTYEAWEGGGLRRFAFDVRELVRAVEIGRPILDVTPRVTVVLRLAGREFVLG